MRRALRILSAALLLVAPLLALGIDNAKFAEHYGVRFDTQAEKLTIAVGQTLTAQVVNTALLARRGLKKTTRGDAVQITLLEGNRLRLMHMPSRGSLLLIVDEAPGAYW
jgi:hypothetical protein